MSSKAYTLQYELSRKQRYNPFLKSGGSRLFAVLGYWSVFTVLGKFDVGIFRDLQGVWLLPIIIYIAYFRHFHRLFKIIFVKSQRMNVRIEEDRIAYSMGRKWRFITIDGMTSIQEMEPEVWTVEHLGKLLIIPKQGIDSDALHFLKERIQQARDYWEKRN